MKYFFIINPAAGQRWNVLGLETLIGRICGAAGVEFSLKKTEYNSHAAVLASEAAGKNFDVVVVAGGDGTINQVGRVLMNTNTALGIIPKGSGNGLAREFGIPLELTKACKDLLNYKEVLMDVGKINDDYFLNMAGVGIDARVGLAFNKMGKTGLRGLYPYFCLAVKEYLHYSPPSVRLTFKGGDMLLKPFLLTMANGRQWGGGAMIAPRAVINDGLLHIAIIEEKRFRFVLPHLPKLFNGRVELLPFLKTIVTDEAVITLEDETPFHFDGEARLWKGPLHIKVLHNALKVKVPPEYQSN